MDNVFNEKPKLDKTDCYHKKYVCRNCSCKFETLTLRTRALTPARREPDFFIHYSGIVPWLYEITVCPNCSIAIEGRLWDSMYIPDEAKLRFALDRVRPLNLTDFCWERSYEMGVVSYRLATIAYAYSGTKYYDRANLALRANYLLRTIGDRMKEEPLTASATDIKNEDLMNLSGSPDEIIKGFVTSSGFSNEPANVRRQEESFKRMALAMFVRAYETEHIETTRYGTAGIMYIIGELMRQFGDYKQAVRWFARVVQEKKCHPQIERLARDQWERAREAYRSEMKA